MLAGVRVPVPTVRVSSLFNKLIAWTYPITEISNYLQWILPICLQLVFAHAFKIFSGKPGARTWADNFLTGYSSLWNLIITLQLHTYLSLLFLCYLLTYARFFCWSDLIGWWFPIFFQLWLYCKALLFHSLSSGLFSIIFYIYLH